MLKDITLGQYFPGQSFVHRLDPRVKLALTFVYIVALFMAKGLLTYGLMLTWLLTAMACSGIPVRLFFKGLRPLIFIIIFTGVLNIFYTEGHVLTQW